MNPNESKMNSNEPKLALLKYYEPNYTEMSLNVINGPKWAPVNLKDPKLINISSNEPKWV